jgi:hypothetical protein
MRPSLTILIACALPWPAFASSASTQCKAGETIVFSCSTGSRILSVCASPDVSAKAGYMQYRYGVKGKPELIYPETLAPPVHLFTPGQLSFSGGGGAYLQFKKGAFTYTVFDAIGNWGESGKGTAQGVAVSSAGKEVANLPCKTDRDYVSGELGPDFFTKAGLGEPTNDFDIPDAFMPK